MQISLSHEHMLAAQRIGKLTFQPLSRNRVRCNQAPDLGPLSPKQADSLRAQFANRDHPATPPKPKTAVTVVATPPPLTPWPMSPPSGYNEPPLVTADSHNDRRNWSWLSALHSERR